MIKPLFYIHKFACISPQQTSGDVNLDVLHLLEEGKLSVIEHANPGIPPSILRRMSKAVRMGMGAALQVIEKDHLPDGIIIGTANAGMEDCFHFLKQMVEYDEGLLTPGSFVQSTPNALAAQLAMISHNNAYNITHVHLGLAFENAMTDAAMLIGEKPGGIYLLGAVDDISSYNYQLNVLAGWYKAGTENGKSFYDNNTPGSVAGEGSAMFLVNGESQHALAKVTALATVHTTDENMLQHTLQEFISSNLKEGEKISLMLSGDSGDSRLYKFHTAATSCVSEGTPVCRFKHLCGEYPTASSFALWLAVYILQTQSVPSTLDPVPANQVLQNILICNNHKGSQHSFMLVSAD